MAKIKYDGVVEAVHYNEDGQLEWARVYQRRGMVFSDRIILSRREFIERLKAGKEFMVGRRVRQMGATFEVSQLVRLVEVNGLELLAAGDAQPEEKDSLDGVPFI
jgi:hypothetical protein